MAQIPCFVVNLATATQRRETMADLCERHGITPRWFDAVDGRIISADELPKYFASDIAAQVYGPMSRSEIGCALSHMGIYRLMVEQGIASAVIFEDDIDLAPDCATLLDQGTGLSSMFSANDPVMVQLTHVPRGYRFGARKIGRYAIVRPHGGVWLTAGYFITLAAAKRILEGAYPVRTVADHWLYFQQEGHVKPYALTPNAVWESALSQVSAIAPERQSRARTRRSFGDYLARLWDTTVVRRLLVKKLPRKAARI